MQKTGRKRHLPSVKSVMLTKKLRHVKTASPIQTAAAAEDSCITEDNDDELTHGLQTTMTASKQISKTKSRLSEMDSGIVIGEEENDSTVDLTTRRNVASLDADVQQKLSVTPAKQSLTKSDADSCDVQICCVESVAVSSQHGNVEKLSDCSTSGVPGVSDYLIRSKLRNRAYEFDDTNNELAGAESQFELFSREMKQQQPEKRLAAKRAEKQQTHASSFSSDVDCNGEMENDADVGGTDNNEIMMVISDADEPASAPSVVNARVNRSW